jgi:hypothetical protein
VFPTQFLSILVCLDRSDILDNLTTSILWKDVALLELKVYVYKCSNILQSYCAPWNNSGIPPFILCTYVWYSTLCVLFVMLYEVPEDGRVQWPKHVAVQHGLKYSTSAV